MRVCLRCEKPIGGHFNRKRCKPCARFLRKRPIGKLTPLQERVVRKYAGRIQQKPLAVKVRTSRSNLIRWARDNNISLDAHSYKPGVVMAVSHFYELHGKSKTQKAFPGVSVRSIVERKGLGMFVPRQTRWNSRELIELARMAGLISEKAQAKYFNRPRGNAGSIHSVWNKRFGFLGGGVNGMVHSQAKYLVNCKARYIHTQYGSGVKNHRRICLWVTMEKCLKRDTPRFLMEAIKTMAQFQKWLHKSADPAKKIRKMIKEREIYDQR